MARERRPEREEHHFVIVLVAEAGRQSVEVPTGEVRRRKERKPRSLLEASDASSTGLRRRSGGDANLARLRSELRAAGVFRPSPGYYPRKLAEVVALLALCVGTLLALRHSAWLLATFPLWALTTGQIVLLAHDTVHNAAFVSSSQGSRVRRALARFVPHLLIGWLAGGSVSWWRQSHNTHHVLSNDPVLDPDIDYPFLAFDVRQARAKAPIFLPILRRQHVLIWFALPAVAVTMRIYSTTFLLRRLLRAERRSHYLLELAGFVGHWALYLTLVFSLVSLPLGIALVALHQAAFGVYLALITATNHWAMPMPDAQRLTFIEHQVTTSRNICGGPLVRFLYGGLDGQIEHHLFAALPRPRLLQARPIVRAFCEERGIAYVEASPSDALKAIYERLRFVAFAMRTRSPSDEEEAA